MEFDHHSRNVYRKSKKQEWEKAQSKKVKALSTDMTELYSNILKLGESGYIGHNICINFWKKNQKKQSFSEFMRKNCKALVKIFVPESLQEDYYAIVDEIPTFQYSVGYNRRSVRTKAPFVHIDHVFGLLYSYMVFGSYHVSVADFVQDKLSEEALNYKRNDNYANEMHLRSFDDILAARLNAGDEAVISAVKEAFLSENNTTIVTVDIIRAVLKCKLKELHELLAKFFVAARLSEGVRQAVCENADCGRMDAFITILDAIAENNMLRFSGVKRAVATWTGICDESNLERISDKLFDGVRRAVSDVAVAKEMTNTEDSVQIITGLWAMGAYEVEDAVAEILRIVEKGSRNQILTISYYNRSHQSVSLSIKVVASVISRYADDLEMIAAYMPSYLNECDTLVRETFETTNEYYYNELKAEFRYKKLPITELFETEEIAREHYGILKQILPLIKKKQLEFAPCIFPWYGVYLTKSDIVERMSVIAYALEDEALIDEVCERLTDISGNYSQRHCYIRMLLHEPQNAKQRNMLLSYVADKESCSRTTAYSILRAMELTEEDYIQLEGYLKYKTEDIRKYVLLLLGKQDSEGRKNSAGRLIASKEEMMRLAGFDMLKNACEKEPEKKEELAAFVKSIIDEDILSDKEKILYDEICGEGGASEVLAAEGYGIYNPAVTVSVPEDVINSGMNLKKHAKVVKDYFDVPKKKLDKVLQMLMDVIDAHKEDEYKDWDGETRLLGNGLFLTSYDRSKRYEDSYPFKELWIKFYEEHIKEPKLFWNLYMALDSGYGKDRIADYKLYKSTEDMIFGDCGSDYQVSNRKYVSSSPYRDGDLNIILGMIKSAKHLTLPLDVCINACLFAAKLQEDRQWYTPAKPENTYMRYNPDDRLDFPHSRKFNNIVGRISHYESDEEFKTSFWVIYALDEAYQFQTKKWHAEYAVNQQRNYLSILSYVKACELNMIAEDSVYKYAFEDLGLVISVEQLSDFMEENPRLVTLQKLESYMPVNLKEKTLDKEHPYYILGQKIYETIVNKILDVELKRGDSATVFSCAVGKINRITGLDRLFAILTALGKDTLDRSTYYYWNVNHTGKKQCLSHLLQVCYPLPEDSLEEFAAGVKKHKITDERLIEVAMYAPQWLDMVEKYLGCDGFKSGCYYFMAHMNECFDDKKAAMIAKYTPLTSEELNDGCFDLDWFKEAYDKLGDKLFDKLYKAAKYISDGSKHTRARKYADAALGRVDRDELEKAIADKRNKDLLMSYGLIPIADEADELHRYEFLQKFLKESKQFGAQRRASESKSVEVALKNMATAAGYADDLRLTLAMETALVSSNTSYFDGVDVDEYNLKAVVNDSGKAELAICKAEKKLKTVPAALKKNETYLEIKEFVSKLKNQYSRCVKMFEKAMEERELYTVGELRKLIANPVTKSILDKLVYGVVEDEESCEAVRLDVLEELLKACSDDVKLKVAHPVDLYQSDKWAEWQQYFFSLQQNTGAKQPFKQVFRELYVKLPEEKDATVSRMFAGNQIQPKKTVGALKARRWVADYENGLQKIYYKDNIIATIYAMADWFSPADVEEPTLEYVAFYNRKTFKPIKLSEIPDVIYSEIMRDTDLAVSVAHAGGVDPMTSHSTIEMRKVIFGFNVKLFKLDNVRFEGSHAFIDGSYGKYSIHLGSGVIHQLGGHQINVLPVHSQSRGKIFLPFVDDDPKTAEIMSKIILFAQDQKIKDPYIMEQIEY